MKITKRPDQSTATQPLSLRDAMNHLFEESIVDPFSSFSLLNPFNTLLDSSFASLETRTFIPKVDISEDQNNFQIDVSIPGYDPKNIEVETDQNTLIIKGKTNQQQEDRNRKYHRRERSYGEFYREIALPTSTDISKISCKNKNGVLTVSVPKVEPKERKKNPITT